MKHLNKSIFTTTLLTSLFLSQPVLAGDEAEHDEYSGHPAELSVFELTEKPKVTYQLLNGTSLLNTQQKEEALDEELFPDFNR